MMIKTTNIEIETYGFRLLFLGVNLGKRWRFETFRDLSGNGLTAWDWVDRKVKDVALAKKKAFDNI